MLQAKTTNRTPALLLGIFLALLLLTNGHLVSEEPPATFGYNQGAVLAGEWWRLITYPFTHVSWYHLALDSAATMILWAILPLALIRKLVVAMVSGAASLGLAVAASPLVAECGLSGLSGIAHGLMTASGLLFLRLPPSEGGRWNAPVAWIGGLLLTVSLGKSLFEVITGVPLFAVMHNDNLGIPIVHAHLGGSLGALIAVTLLARRTPVALPTTDTSRPSHDKASA